MRNKFYFAILVLCLGCAQNKPAKEKSVLKIIPSKEITFNSGLASNHKFTDVYYHLPDSTEYFYFANPVTDKIINIITRDNELKWHIPLNEVYKFCNGIDNFGIIHPDTVLVLSEYTNMLFWLNRKGECYHKIWLDSVTINKEGDYFNFSSSVFQSFLVNSNTLLFALDWERDLNDTLEPSSGIEYRKYFYKHKYKAASFLELKITGIQIKTYSYGLNDFYKHIIKSQNEYISELPLHASANGKYFKVSVCSDKIFEIDPKTLKVAKEYKVVSDYTKIGWESNNASGKKYGQYDWVRTICRTSGSINRILYDPFRHLYYVTVYHEVDVNTPDEHSGSIRPFSLIVFDENFKKLNELTFPEKSYISGNMIVCREGLLISSNFTDRKDYDPKKAIFTLFKVER